MSFFIHEEETKHSSKPFNLFRETLKEVFGQCWTCHPNSPTLFSIEEENAVNDNEDIADEQEVVILAIRTRAMEAKLRNKNGCSLTTQNLHWVLSQMNTGELIINNPNKLLLKQKKQQEQEEEHDEDRETFFSARSNLSHCSSTSCLSCCSSKRVFKFSDVNGKRSIMEELCHCEGWPFGLCRKTLLLPPLPNSPSESWLWRKTPPHMVKILK